MKIKIFHISGQSPEKVIQAFLDKEGIIEKNKPMWNFVQGNHEYYPTLIITWFE
jgi:hypothetical protein